MNIIYRSFHLSIKALLLTSKKEVKMNDFSCSVAIQQSVAQSMMKGNHVVILVDFKEKEAFGVLNFERKEDFNLSYIHHSNLKTFGLPIRDSRKIEMAPLALLGDNVRSII